MNALPPQPYLRNQVSLIPTEIRQEPWSAERLPPGHTAGAGCVTFEPDRVPGYDNFALREPIRRTDISYFGPQPVSPAADEEVDEYDVVHSNSGSSMAHESPKSEGASWCIIDSSPQDSPSPYQAMGHSSVFSSRGRSPLSPKPPRGRQRALTTQQRSEALSVRKAKACWACHLSKIKVSVKETQDD